MYPAGKKNCRTDWGDVIDVTDSLKDLSVKTLKR